MSSRHIAPTRIPATEIAAAWSARPARRRVRSALRAAVHALLASCPHDGPMTPLSTLRGAEVWRCELCGSPVVFADELTPEPAPPRRATHRSSRTDN